MTKFKFSVIVSLWRGSVSAGFCRSQCSHDALGRWVSNVICWWLGFGASKVLLVSLFHFNLLCSEPQDGMDQSKWALPRNRIVQSSREAAAIARPRMKLHGLWVHGVSLNLYICHPGVPADSSLVCECFARALQDCEDTFQRARKPMPKECLVFVSQLQEGFPVSTSECFSLIWDCDIVP